MALLSFGAGPLLVTYENKLFSGFIQNWYAVRAFRLDTMEVKCFNQLSSFLKFELLDDWSKLQDWMLIVVSSPRAFSPEDTFSSTNNQIVSRWTPGIVFIPGIDAHENRAHT
jgi:hypothetical protein